MARSGAWARRDWRERDVRVVLAATKKMMADIQLMKIL